MRRASHWERKLAAAPEMGAAMYSPVSSATGDSGRSHGRTNDDPANNAASAFEEQQKQLLNHPHNEAHPFPVGANQSALLKRAAEDWTEKLLASAPVPVRHGESPAFVTHGDDKYITHNIADKSQWPGLAHEMGHADVDKSALGSLSQSGLADLLMKASPVVGGAQGLAGVRWPVTLATAGLMAAPRIGAELAADYHGYQRMKALGADDATLREYLKGIALPQASYAVAPALAVGANRAMNFAMKHACVIAHIAGPGGSGKTTLGNLLKEKHPGLVVKDLDEFDDHASAELFGDKRKKDYTDDNIAALAKRRQQLMDRFLEQQGAKPVVLVGHHTEGSTVLNIPTTHKWMLSTTPETSARRAWQRSQSEREDHRRSIQELPDDIREARETVQELRGLGYQRISSTKIKTRIADLIGPMALANTKTAKHKLARRMSFRGLDISIETDTGDKREWYDPHADKHGVTVMKYPYGYIRKTLGTDGDHVDVYVGPDEEAAYVYVVNQMKAPEFREFDEQKVFLGFANAAAAKKAYLDHYTDKRFFGSMKRIGFEDFKEKVLDKGNHGEKVAAHADTRFSERSTLDKSHLANLRTVLRAADLTKLPAQFTVPMIDGTRAVIARVGDTKPKLTLKTVLAARMKSKDPVITIDTLHATKRASLSDQQVMDLAGFKQTSSQGLPETQITRGAAIEEEHTDRPGIAKQIAVDHLNERPDYYKLLEHYVENAPLGAGNKLANLRDYLAKRASDFSMFSPTNTANQGPGPTHNQVPGDFLGLPMSQPGGYKRIVGGHPEVPDEGISRTFRFHDEPTDAYTMDGNTAAQPSGPAI